MQGVPHSRRRACGEQGPCRSAAQCGRGNYGPCHVSAATAAKGVQRVSLVCRGRRDVSGGRPPGDGPRHAAESLTHGRSRRQGALQRDAPGPRVSVPGACEPLLNLRSYAAPRRDVAHVLEMRHRPLLLCVAPGGGMEGARAQGHMRLVPAVCAGGGVPLRAFYPVSRARDGAVWSRERPGPSL